jgi:ABC-type nitrate/sulfonate/bicarbonate transport system permease component
MVTLTFCPGLRFCTPIFVPVSDGLGTIVTGFFVGLGVGLTVGFAVGLIRV